MYKCLWPRRESADWCFPSPAGTIPTSASLGQDESQLWNECSRLSPLSEGPFGGLLTMVPNLPTPEGTFRKPEPAPKAENRPPHHEDITVTPRFREDSMWSPCGFLWKWWAEFSKNYGEFFISFGEELEEVQKYEINQKEFKKGSFCQSCHKTWNVTRTPPGVLVP
jgi:hypothetical protein